MAMLTKLSLILAGMGLFTVGGCVTAEVLADAGALLDVLNLIVGWLPALL